MAIQFKFLDVSAVVAYPVDPQMVFTLEPQVMHIQNGSTMAGAFISFDGVNDHAFVGEDGAAYIRLEQKSSRVWLRRESNQSENVYITVEGGAPQNPGFI